MNTKTAATLRTLRAIGGPPALGTVLRGIRESEGLSQSEFAKRMKVRPSHISDLERGTKGISVERAAKFAKILGYPVAQFVEMAVRQQLVEAGFKKAIVTITLAA
jgi:transcriptional regulator with XRE-family HTH domain